METKKIDEPSLREAVERIAASADFARAPRLSQMLRFAVEETLAGRAEALKEYTLAQAVYGRDDYDPKVDSLVRVEMAKLRKRLEAYYGGAGSDERIRIAFAKGSYSPLLTERAVGEPGADERLAKGAGEFRWARGRHWTLGAVAFSLAAAAIWGPGVVVEWRRATVAGSGGPARIALEMRALESGGRDAVASLQSAMRERLARNTRLELVDTRAANAILQADVSVAGDHLRVALQLRQRSDGYVAWSESLEAAPGEAADEIAAKIFYNLPGTLRAFRERGTQSQDAWHFYLRGMQAIDQAEAAQAMEMFRAALARDERDALAWAGLSRARVMAADWYDAGPESLREARESAARAWELSPDSVLVLQALGAAQVFHDHDFVAAERSLRRAIQLDPTEVDVRYDLARLVLSPLGRHREAEEELKSAIAMNPEHNLLWNALVYVYLRSGRAEAALEAAQRPLALVPKSPAAHLLRGMALLELGRTEEALREFEFRDSDWSRGMRALALATNGKSEEARASLAELRDPSRRAAVLAALGEKEAALAALEEAVRRNAPTALWIGVEPAFAALRGEPRFQTLCERMGLKAGAAAR